VEQLSRGIQVRRDPEDKTAAKGRIRRHGINLIEGRVATMSKCNFFAGGQYESYVLASD
jgi:hypothetical protein